jgi:hypothetical protein
VEEWKMDEARSWDLERESTVYECGCMVGASVAEFSRVLVAERERERERDGVLSFFERF